MKLVTRCPECNTAFRVYEEQLEARGGQVRCGTCKQIFDAYATLEERPLDAEGPPTLMPRDLPRRATPAPVSKAPTPRVVTIGTGIPAAVGSTTGNTTAPPKAFLPEESAPARTSANRDHDDDRDGEDIDFARGNQRTEPAGTRWVLAVIALALVLAAQLIYLFRGEVVARVPGARAVIGPICVAIGCDIALPRHAENIQVEASDLQSDGGAMLTLTTTLRNKASFSQALPSLELTLTDARDLPIARKILRPIDYLDTPAIEATGIPAGGDVVAKVYIDASQISANSYRLFLFYP